MPISVSSTLEPVIGNLIDKASSSSGLYSTISVFIAALLNGPAIRPTLMDSAMKSVIGFDLSAQTNLLDDGVGNTFGSSAIVGQVYARRDVGRVWGRRRRA
jgi:hypothetical protein